MLFPDKPDISSGRRGSHCFSLLHSGLCNRDHDGDSIGEVYQEHTEDDDDDELTKCVEFTREGKSFLFLLFCPAVDVEIRQAA